MSTFSVPDDATLATLFSSVKTIALVGASANAARPSNGVMRFLQGLGFKVYPVNPGLAGQDLNGEPVFKTLSDVPAPIDMVDVFRRSEEIADLVDQCLDIKDEKNIRIIWTQLGVIDAYAQSKAESNGLVMIMNRCPAIDIPRLINSGLYPPKT